MKVITEINNIEDIPAILFYREGAIRDPIVTVFHGFGNDKYEGTKLALKLCKEGFAVLCFDADRHGERYDGFIELIDSDVGFGNELFRVLENTASDFKVLRKAMDKHPSVDVNRLGLVGISHGANICNYILTKTSDIKACVSLLGAPDFEGLIVYSMEKESVDDFTTDDEKNLLDYVRKLNPYSDLLLSSIPLLMINGSKDDNVPYKFSESLSMEMKNQGTTAFDLEDEFHYVSSTMEDKTIAWLRQHIL